jgi:hypothetical protein
MDVGFRERFLALQRLEMANAGYICERRNAAPDKRRPPDARRVKRANCKIRKLSKTVKDSDAFRAGA